MDSILTPSRIHEYFIYFLSAVNKLPVQQCFAFTLQANFLALIWNFTEDEGDGVESGLSS